MKISVVVLLVFLNVPVFAQPPDTLWTCTFGGSSLEECVSVQPSFDGGYVFGGWTESFGNGNQSNYWLVKTDESGHLLWNRRYGGNASCHSTSMKQTSDSGYVLAGWSPFGGVGDWNFWLLKTNASGDSLWSRAYGGAYADQCQAVQQTSDGGYALAGGTFSFGAGDWDFWLVKTNSDGDSLWSRTYGGIYEDYCTTAQQTSDGGYILGGWTDVSGAGIYDFWLVKTNANGDSLWSHTYGGEGVEECWTVIQTSDHGYILGGWAMPRSLGPADFWVVKTDSNGNELWNRTYGGAGWDGCTVIQQTADGGYVLGGATWSYGNGMNDIWLIRTDAQGNTLWDKTFGGSSEDYCLAFGKTSDGGFLLGGTTYSFGAGLFDFWVVKTTPDMVEIESDFIPPPSSFALSAFPNPFNPSATITFTLPQTVRARLAVYDLLGREVRVLADATYIAGEHAVRFDGSDLPSGLYLANLQSGTFTATQKLLLLK